MTVVRCSWCNPSHVIFEREPLEDKTEVETICPAAYKSIMEAKGAPTVDIPEDLGKCEITRVEEEGDIHVLCDNKFYKVGIEGEVTPEDAPEDEEVSGVDFVELAAKSTEG